MEKHAMFMVWNSQCSKDTNIFQTDRHVNIISIKILGMFFMDIGKIILKFIKN